MRDSWFAADPARMPLGRLLAVTGQRLGRCQQRVAAAHGLTPTSIGVLGVLSDSGRLSHRELSGRLGVTPATLTSVVDALEAHGDVTRERDTEDRRVVRLSITAAGRERLATAFDGMAAEFRERLPDPPPGPHAIIRSHLLAVLAALDADLDSGLDSAPDAGIDVAPDEDPPPGA